MLKWEKRNPRPWKHISWPTSAENCNSSHDHIVTPISTTCPHMLITYKNLMKLLLKLSNKKVYIRLYVAILPSRPREPRESFSLWDIIHCAPSILSINNNKAINKKAFLLWSTNRSMVISMHYCIAVADVVEVVTIASITIIAV